MPGPLTAQVLEVLLRNEDVAEILDETGELLDAVDNLAERSLMFDREGEPLTLREWTALWAFEPYRIIGKTDVGGYQVSTVWLGLDHSYGHGPPLIFETMVFEAELSYKTTEWFPEGFWYRRDFDMRRYATEAGAQAGHRRTCEELRVKLAAMPNPLDEPA